MWLGHYYLKIFSITKMREMEMHNTPVGATYLSTEGCDCIDLKFEVFEKSRKDYRPI